MIFAMSKDGTLSCSPNFLKISVKFCPASAMRTSCRLRVELQPLLECVQGQSGQSTDHGAIEADKLQVAADREFDATDQHVDVPGLHLVGNETAHAALLSLHE